MIELFDKRFTVNYTEDERLVIYLDGNEFIKKKVPGLNYTDDIKREANRILTQKYSANKIYTIQEVADECGVTRVAISLRLNEMIRGLHYTKAESKASGVNITEDGRAAIIARMKKTPD